LNDQRLSAMQREALGNPDNEILVSPVIAYELTHLQMTTRIPLREPMDRLQQLIGFDFIDLPHGLWRAVGELPDIHRDPIDRMLIAHALSDDMILVTADATIRRYPVASI
jgi:PIN domain nuclease of toxin-antitoxin system